jgi:Tfp pilus assembly protein PilE
MYFGTKSYLKNNRNHTAKHALQDVQDMSHHYYAKSKCKLLHRTFKTHKTKITQQKQDKRTTIARHVGLLLQHFFPSFYFMGVQISLPNPILSGMVVLACHLCH